MTNVNNILVLDCAERSALAIVRNLGQHHHRVYCGADTDHSLAGKSRYCHREIRYSSPYLKPMEFMEDLCRITKEHDIGIILPATDVTTSLLAQHRAMLSDVVIPVASSAQIDRLSNKYALFKQAESLGLPIPITRYIDNLSQAHAAVEGLVYPVVMKPFRSRILTEQGFLSTSVRIVRSREEFLAALENHVEFQTHPFLLQDYIEGEGAGYFVLYDQNRHIAGFSHRRLREKPPSGGVSVLSESAPVNPLLRDYSYQLLDTAGWHGVAMVEFKIAPDGTPYLMEINTRFWGSLQLAIDAGIEFPELLYRIGIQEVVPATQEYTTGVRLRWLLGDLDRLWIVLKSSNYDISEKFRQLLSFLNFFSPRTRFEVIRWGDMGPFIYEIRKYIRDLIA